MFKKIGKMALLPMLVLGVVGCNASEDEKYIGKWSDSNTGINFTFIKDSTCIMAEGSNVYASSSSCSWGDNKITVKNKEHYFYKLDGATLYIDGQENELTASESEFKLTKVK